LNNQIWFDLVHPANVHWYLDSIISLKSKGYEVICTVRDFEHLPELMDFYNISYVLLPDEKTSSKELCMSSITKFIKTHDIKVLITQGSYYVPSIAHKHGIKCIATVEYADLQSRNVSTLPYSDIILLPRFYKKRDIVKQGADPLKIIQFKSFFTAAVIFSNFVKSTDVLKMLGIENEDRLISIRPLRIPSLFYRDLKVIYRIARTFKDVKVIVLPRDRSHERIIQRYLLHKKIIIPSRAFDYVNLYKYSKVVVGGTVALEAALVGTIGVWSYPFNPYYKRGVSPIHKFLIKEAQLRHAYLDKSLFEELKMALCVSKPKISITRLFQLLDNPNQVLIEQIEQLCQG